MVYDEPYVAEYENIWYRKRSEIWHSSMEHISLSLFLQIVWIVCMCVCVPRAHERNSFIYIWRTIISMRVYGPSSEEVEENRR